MIHERVRPPFGWASSGGAAKQHSAPAERLLAEGDEHTHLPANPQRAGQRARQPRNVPPLISTVKVNCLLGFGNTTLGTITHFRRDATKVRKASKRNQGVTHIAVVT